MLSCECRSRLTASGVLRRFSSMLLPALRLLISNGFLQKLWILVFTDKHSVFIMNALCVFH